MSEVLSGLGAGERAAIVLAKDLTADLLLMDERRARRAAQRLAISVVGCIGILEVSARSGKISNLRLLYLELLNKGVRIQPMLLRESLRRLGLPEL